MTENANTKPQTEELTEQDLEAVNGGSVQGPYQVKPKPSSYIGPCDANPGFIDTNSSL